MAATVGVVAALPSKMAETYAENLRNFSITQEIFLPKNEKTFDIMDSGEKKLSDYNISVDNNLNEMCTQSEVQQFYHGKNVLITGATGFLGKVLVEKLLRSCPGVENLYLLVRQKKGKDIYTRVEEVFEDPVFSRLKEEVPKFRHKVVVVPADCDAAGLGLTLSDRQMLTEKVNIIFHSAATVKFDEHLRAALVTNVRAPLHLLRLARDMKHLDVSVQVLVLMHISTAYSHCHMRRIEERFYPCEVDFEHLYQMLEKKSDREVDDMLPMILGRWPNTYTLTKAMAEKELKKDVGHIPLGIFRPAIVTSTAKEPVKCWIDNMYGPIGVTVGSVTGILRTLNCCESVTANIVPVDLVVNCLIVAASTVHKAYKQSEPPPEPPIFNYVSSVENRITWAGFMAQNMARVDLHPLSNAVWYISLRLTSSPIMNQIYTFFLHLVPAALIDFLTICVGGKPKMLKVYKKVHKFSAVISYFSTKEIEFCNRRTRQLWEETSSLDQQLFPFSMAEVDWQDYFADYLKGIRRYIFKETDDTLPQARIKWQRLYYLHQIVKIVFFAIGTYVLWWIFSMLF